MLLNCHPVSLFCHLMNGLCAFLAEMAISEVGGHPPSGAVPITAFAIDAVALKIPGHKECCALARALDFLDKSEFISLTKASFDDMTTQKTLGTWALKKGRRATGAVLYDALYNKEVGLGYVADACEDLLLGKQAAGKII